MSSETILIISPHAQNVDSYALSKDNNYRNLVIADYLQAKLNKSVYHLRLIYSQTADTNINDGETFHFSPDISNFKTNKRLTSRGMLSCIEKLRPSLVIFKGLGYTLPSWIVANSRHRFKIVFIVGGGTVDPILQYADYIFAESSKQIKKSFLWHSTQGRVRVLPKLNRPISLENSPDKLFDVINVGRFKELKNQKALLPLALNNRVALIGDGETYDSVKKLASAFANPVFMPGDVPRDEVINYVAQSRIMVHASKSEGVPRVVMEAFECGVPVIGLRSTLEGVFEHGVHGLLVEPDELVDAALELLGDPYRIEEMGKNARRFAEGKCNHEAVLKAVDEMVVTVFSGGPYSPSERLTKIKGRWILLRSDMFFFLRKYLFWLKRATHWGVS